MSSWNCCGSITSICATTPGRWLSSADARSSDGTVARDAAALSDRVERLTDHDSFRRVASLRAELERDVDSLELEGDLRRRYADFVAVLEGSTAGAVSSRVAAWG